MQPHDMRQFRHIEEVFRGCCSSWGYQEVRTPTLEYLHLFTSTGALSPSMLSRVYSFLDWDGWSGERVVLRPDGTIPSARLYADNLPDRTLSRLCYVENMFTFEGTGQESRERWQCGAELLGGTEPEGDAELIMLALEILRRLGIDSISVKLSHVGLFKTLVRELGATDDDRTEALTEVLKGNIKALSKIDDHGPEVRRFLKLLLDVQGKSSGFLMNLMSILPARLSGIRASLDDLAEIARLLDGLGQAYQIDSASAEGFEYYTGMGFQFYGAGQLLGRGGRYDELVPLVGGAAVPASGFALFMDRLMPLVPEEPAPSRRIILTRESEKIEGMRSTFEMASLLRQQGYIVEIGPCVLGASDCRWIVTLANSSGPSRLSLADRASGKEQKGLSVDQLLQELAEATCP